MQPNSLHIARNGSTDIIVSVTVRLKQPKYCIGLLIASFNAIGLFII